MSKLLTIHQIRGLRIGNKIAQKDFAELMGMPASSWSNVEVGNNKFQPWMQEKATKLMQELGLYRPDRVQEHAVEVIEVPVVNQEGEQEDNPVLPQHYHKGGIDLFKFLDLKWTNEQMQGFYAGNVMKYVLRYSKKNGIEDLEKAEVFLHKLIETVKQHEQGE